MLAFWRLISFHFGLLGLPKKSLRQQRRQNCRPAAHVSQVRLRRGCRHFGLVGFLLGLSFGMLGLRFRFWGFSLWGSEPSTPKGLLHYWAQAWCFWLP